MEKKNEVPNVNMYVRNSFGHALSMVFTHMDDDGALHFCGSAHREGRENEATVRTNEKLGKQED